jgi:hypothetical protein
VADPDALEEAIDLVFDPSGNGRSLGPPGASISPEILVHGFVLRARALIALKNRDHPVSDQIFERARTDLRQQLLDYTRNRPQLITDADASLQHLFSAPLLQQVIPDACRNLITSIGHQLTKEDQP